MSTASPTILLGVAQAAPVRPPVRRVGRPRTKAVEVRTAAAAEAEAIHALVSAHLTEGHLLPRERDEIALHAHRFVVATRAGKIVACADLAPLSRSVAEVRSFVVDQGVRGAGIGGQVIDELLRRATLAGYDTLCAFTHAPSYFVRHGFSLVPHVWLPDKIETDCHACRHFRQCGQYALARPLVKMRRPDAPPQLRHA